MSKKQLLYKEENEAFLHMKAQEGVEPLVAGVLHEVLQVGEGPSPTLSNIVSVYYKGMLINGKVFDDNTMQGYPDAFRLNDLIDGWKIALTRMQVGDKWRIYVPASLGYGAISTPGIPKHSTLIFEIELVGIA
jgi:peptidylprolyl isomerase